MKSTLADIKQLFNVTNIAYNTNMNALAEGQFGIFPEDSEVSVVTGTTYATLPAKIRIISKLNGKLYYSFDSIEKARIFNQAVKPYQTEQINIWKGIIDHCNCIDGVQLKINIDEQSLIQRDGLTWTHSDSIVEVSPQELLCFCSCDGTKPVYENNVLTQLLNDKINASKSPFYESQVELPITSLVTYANQAALNTAVPTPATGALAIVTGEGVKQYNGTAWVVIGTVLGVLTDVATFVTLGKTVNTDANTTNDGLKLTLVIKGKLSASGTYADLDVNYVYPRGVRLNPALRINNEKSIVFTQTQGLRYEIGAGYDLRKEEFDNMNFYTNMNFYPQLSDGIASSNLTYQFENKKNYNTLTFEFDSKKSGLEDVHDGRYKRFGVLIGTTSTTLYNELVAMFVA